jgi:hypothetical protein
MIRSDGARRKIYSSYTKEGKLVVSQVQNYGAPRFKPNP